MGLFLSVLGFIAALFSYRFIMLARVLSNVSGTVRTHLKRNIYISAPALQQATAIDPIQQLFVDKIRDYASKSKAAGGDLVDATPDVKTALQDELDKVNRAHNAEGQDMAAFPAFTWADPTLEPVSVETSAPAAAGTTTAAVAEEADDDISSTPYFDL